MQPYETQTFPLTGPNGEPLFAVVALHYDEEGDSSYYRDPERYAGLPDAAREEYEAQDAARLAALYRGDWHYCGVVATVYGADLAPVADFAVWGFESDDPELANLREHHVTVEAIADACRELAEAHRAACADVATV